MINKWLFEVAFASGEMKRNRAKAELQARQSVAEYRALLLKAERQERRRSDNDFRSS